MLGSDFLTFGAKLAFIELKQAFFKVPIFHHFDLKHHIQIETGALGYIIGGILSQLTLQNRWYLVVFFSYKMILVKIRYKMHDGELLVIVEVFKT